MLWCMPESDNWQLEKSYIRAISADLYEQHLREVVRYKDTQQNNIFTKARRTFKRAKKQFKEHWKSMDDYGREKEAENYYDDLEQDEANDYARHVGLIRERMRPVVFK